MDNEELKDLLQKNFEVSQENNKLIHKIYRSIVWGRIAKIAYWIIIIGVAIGAFYFAQPYLGSLFNTFNDVRGDSVERTQQFQEFFGSGTTTK